MSNKRVLVCAALLVALSARCSLAWWVEGHVCIDQAAASVLPDEMPRFFRAGGERIASYSMEPDLWTNPDTPALRSSERFNHFLDLELLGGRELPATRGEFYALCRDLELDPAAVGALPYAVGEWYDRLVLAFAEHRRRPADRAIRNKVLYVAGVLSHYAGDASQPLHCTIHYDGRVGPDGVSPRTGIHAKMDALPGNARLRPEEVAEGLDVVRVEDVFATIVSAIEASNGRVARAYELESRLPPVEGPAQQEVPAEVRGLALERCRAGAELTAALWYSAWVDSAGLQLPDWYVTLPRARRTGP